PYARVPGALAFAGGAAASQGSGPRRAAAGGPGRRPGGAATRHAGRAAGPANRRHGDRQAGPGRGRPRQPERTPYGAAPMLKFRKIAAASKGGLLLRYFTENTPEPTTHKPPIDEMGRTLEDGGRLTAYYLGRDSRAAWRPDMPPVLAQAIGIDPRRTPRDEEMARLFEAKRADTGEAWSRHQCKVSGLDLVFSPHKSVSLAAEFASSPAESALLWNCVDRAADRAMRHVGSVLGWARKGHGGEEGADQGAADPQHPGRPARRDLPVRGAGPGRPAHAHPQLPDEHRGDTGRAGRLAGHEAADRGTCEGVRLLFPGRFGRRDATHRRPCRLRPHRAGRGPARDSGRGESGVQQARPADLRARPGVRRASGTRLGRTLGRAEDDHRRGSQRRDQTGQAESGRTTAVARAGGG